MIAMRCACSDVIPTRHMTSSAIRKPPTKMMLR